MNTREYPPNQSAQTPVTKCHRLEELDNRILFSLEAQDHALSKAVFGAQHPFPPADSCLPGPRRLFRTSRCICCVHPQDTSLAGLVLSPNLSHFSVKTLSPYAGTLGLPHVNLGSTVLMTSKIMERGHAEVNPWSPCPIAP